MLVCLGSLKNQAIKPSQLMAPIAIFTSTAIGILALDWTTCILEIPRRGKPLLLIPGICDSEIMNDFIAPIFAKDEKIFMYWLTLNTHTNFDERDIQTDVFDCKKFNLEEGEQLCRMNKLHAQFFSQLAGILAQPAMRGVEIILVGDHSPPILNKREYRIHVEDGLVMQVHLKVKD